MPNSNFVSYPNQKFAFIHRTGRGNSFLQISKENWYAASRDLGAYGLQLYLFFVGNEDNFKCYFSPAAIQNLLGMSRSTYHRHFNDLIQKGYLVQRKDSNTYDFYEVSQNHNTNK